MWQIWTHPAPNHPTNPTSTTQNLDTPRITFTARVGQFQCTYRCVVLPDARSLRLSSQNSSLNAPTGAWCSPTRASTCRLTSGTSSQCTYRCVVLPDKLPYDGPYVRGMSQCTYRCVVLPDQGAAQVALHLQSQCTYRCVVLPDEESWTLSPSPSSCLNAPTGAWCSLTRLRRPWPWPRPKRLNAPTGAWCSLTRSGARRIRSNLCVSMHLQVRGAP